MRAETPHFCAEENGENTSINKVLGGHPQDRTRQQSQTKVIGQKQEVIKVRESTDLVTINNNDNHKTNNVFVTHDFCGIGIP